MFSGVFLVYFTPFLPCVYNYSCNYIYRVYDDDRHRNGKHIDNQITILPPPVEKPKGSKETEEH